jgi:hypothetical protein
MDASRRLCVTPRPIAQYLARFGEEHRCDLTADGSCEPADLAARAESTVGEETLALDLVREEGWSEGYAAGFAAAGREQDEARQSESFGFDARLASERVRWVEEQGAGLSAKLDAALAAIEARIGASVARILRPCLAKLLRERVVDELAESVGLILGGQDQKLIEVSGPEDLLDSIQRRLTASAGSLAWTPSASTDVKVVADQAIIESRIEAWVHRIDALSK